MTKTEQAEPFEGHPDIQSFMSRCGHEIIEVRVPLVGEGNPAAAAALYSLIRAFNLQVISRQLQLMSVPANVFHRIMSRSKTASQAYTQGADGGLRGRLGPTLASLAGIETMRSSANILIAVQEFSLGNNPDRLRQMYSDGVYIYIPDVHPKSSAVDILRKMSFVNVIVWNRQAAESLSRHGIDLNRIITWPPLLPYGLLAGQGEIRVKHQPNKVVIKSSGSGWPSSFGAALVQAASRLASYGFNVIMVTPDEERKWPRFGVESSTPRLGNKLARAAAFYEGIARQPPGVIISYPSEMVQAVYSLRQAGYDVCFFALPPRGGHEQANLDFAISQGLKPKLLKQDTSLWPEYILDTLAKRATSAGG